MLFFFLYVLNVPNIAFAGAPAGSATPTSGGSLGGVYETSVLGLHINPASAYGTGFELKLDVGLLLYSLGGDLVGPEQEPFLHDFAERYGELPKGFSQITGSVRKTGQMPIPSLGISFPIGPIGIGLETFVPFGTGAEFDPKGPQRFASTGGKSIFFEQDLALAVPINIQNSRLSIGAALRGGYAQLASDSATDTGTMLYHISEGELDDFVLDPALEGTKSFATTGLGFGYALGAHWEGSRFSLHGSYRSKIKVDVEGSYQTYLSNSLNVSLKGKANASVTYPAEMYLGATIPFRQMKLFLEAGWVGWSSWRYLQGEVSELELQSDSALFQNLISLYAQEYEDELSSSITADQKFLKDNGNRDVYIGRAAFRVPLGRKWATQFSLAYSTNTIPLEYTTLSNVDYPTTNMGIIGLWTPQKKITFALSAEYLFRMPKTITDSVYKYSNPPETGLTGFSGEGDYFFRMGRVGFTTHLHL